MSIRYKMIIFISIIMLVSISIISAIWYVNTSNIVDEHIESTAEDLMHNAYNAFDYILTDTEYLLSIISLNEDAIIKPLGLINNENKISKKNLNYTQLENIRIIKDYIGSLYGYKYYITGISVIDLDGNQYKMGSGHRNDNDIAKDLLLASEKPEHQRGKIIMLSPIKSEDVNKVNENAFVVPAGKVILNKNDEIVGYAVIYFDYSIINKMFSDNLPDDSKFKVIDGNGNIVYNNNNLKADEGYIYSEYHAEKADWYFTMGIQSEPLKNEINQTMRTTWVVFGVVYIILVALGIIFIYRMTKKLNVLSKAMNKVAEGDLAVQTDIKSGDEIEEMSNSFNGMVVEIRDLIDKVADEEKQKREAEMNFLQEQMNPHFLSNVLNTIIWMAKIYKANNIVKLTQSLISLLRLVMKKGDSLICVEEEIQHVKSYIDVIDYSASYDFEINYNIDDNVKTCKMIRFILQPFVENAIIHGGERDQIDQNHNIYINAYKNEENLILTIVDNGKGMSELEIEELFAETKKDKMFKHIGIKNVSERITLTYGENYGVKINSEQSEYTQVVINLPLIY